LARDRGAIAGRSSATRLARAVQQRRHMGRNAIRHFMSPAPHTIGADQPLSLAGQLMVEHHLRCLPVLRAGHAVGLLSERDVQLVAGLPSVNPAHVMVEEAMSEDVYAVPGDTPFDEVASAIAHRQYAAALVTERGKVTGVLTTIDALAALADGAPAPMTTPPDPPPPAAGSRKRRPLAH
jgi:acetoin utilization protein AcuB